MIGLYFSRLKYYIFVVLFLGNLCFIAIITTTLKKEKIRADIFEEKYTNIQIKYKEQLKRLKQVSDLDQYYTRALQYENDFINDLHWRVESGTERLYVAADCKPGLSGSSGTASLDDAATPGLSQDAQQAYFTHRRELARAEKVILGLQTYIKEQCTR